jgi:hypothetical protein
MPTNKDKDIILSNIISLNPTGKLDYNGTFSLEGNNNIINTPEDASKTNLDKTMNNEVICGIENFENNNIQIIKNNKLNNNDLILYNKYLISLFLIIVILFLLFIYK